MSARVTPAARALAPEPAVGQGGAAAASLGADAAAALRAARLQIIGSGQGSVPTGDILTELPAIADRITNGAFRVDARAVPLADIEAVWNETDARQRIVVTP